MGTEHVTKKEYEPVGPYAPPKPSEAEQEKDRPVAVEKDYQSKREADKPTGQTHDQFSREVAERVKDPNMERVGKGDTPTPHGKRVEERDDENVQAESPPGYKPSEQEGYIEMETEGDEPR